MDNESTKILEKIHTRLGWIAIWLFLLVCGVGIGYQLDSKTIKTITTKITIQIPVGFFSS